MKKYFIKNLKKRGFIPHYAMPDSLKRECSGVFNFFFSMKFSFSKRSAGFTLVETLIYIAIFAATITSLVSFSILISDANIKNYVVEEVQTNGRSAMDLIGQKIRAATDVNAGSSVFGSDPGVLSLAMADGAKNPTIIDLSQNDGILRIKEGAGSAIAITSSKIKITNLVFTDLSTGSSKKNIRVQLTAEFNNLGSDIKYNYSQSFQTAVSLRQ